MNELQDATGFNREEMLADVREAFVELEAAIATGRVSRCRSFVSDSLYGQVTACVDDLWAQGRRRAHGSFEIHHLEVLDSRPATGVRVRLQATSSIALLDRQGRIVDGSFALKMWAQDVTVSRFEASPQRPRWIITQLGDLAVEGDVRGPVNEPMSPTQRQALQAERNRREQEDEEFWAALRTVSRNFLTAVGSP